MPYLNRKSKNQLRLKCIDLYVHKLNVIVIDLMRQSSFLSLCNVMCELSMKMRGSDTKHMLKFSLVLNSEF